MKPMIIFCERQEDNKEGKGCRIILTREELEDIVEKAYEQGKIDERVREDSVGIHIPYKPVSPVSPVSPWTPVNPWEPTWSWTTCNINSKKANHDE